MDEPWLGELLDRVAAAEPPMGPVAHNALRAGIRLRRRRRVQSTAACAAVVAVAAVVPEVAGAYGPATGPPAGGGTRSPTVLAGGVIGRYGGPGFYDRPGFVTPISTATNTAGRSIRLPGGIGAMTATPDGKTVYVLSGLRLSKPGSAQPGSVTPINVATDTAGKPVKVGRGPTAMAVTPDGKTLYVMNAQSVTPISVATDTTRKPIKVSGRPEAMMITPDGKTLYVAGFAGTVTPISVATSRAGQPIKISGMAHAFVSLAITPDSKTLYVAASKLVTPVSVAANRAGQPIKVARPDPKILMSPDGKTVYAIVADAVIPISTATSTAGRPITPDSSRSQIVPLDPTITPNGKTIYAVGLPNNRITPIFVTTRRVGPPILPPCQAPETSGTPVSTPRGHTAYFASPACDSVTPLNTATNAPGQPIRVGGVPLLILAVP